LTTVVNKSERERERESGGVTKIDACLVNDLFAHYNTKRCSYFGPKTVAD
jgi:hypothetical protein